MGRVWLLAVLWFGCGAPGTAPPAQPAAPWTPRESREVQWNLAGEPGPVRVLRAGQGDAPLLVLVHGLGPGARDFAPVFAALAQTRPVVAFDLPGFGGSSRGGAYTPERYGRVLAGVVDSLGGGPVDLLGHSMGGALCIAYAAEHPGKVRRLVLADVAGLLHPEALVSAQLERSVARLTRRQRGVERAISGTLAPLGRTLRSVGPDLRPFTRYHMLDGTPGTAAGLALAQHDFGAAMAAVTASTLLLWGERDTVAPTRTAELLFDRLPAARLVMFRGVGHVPMTAAPEPFAAQVTAFLGEPDFPAPPDERAPEIPLGRCRDAHGAHFRGRYHRIELRGCRGAVLSDVTTAELVIAHSDASLTHVTVTEHAGIDDSDVVITGGRFVGTVALDIAGSRVDAAGLALVGSQAAVRCRSSTRLLFSVTRAESRLGIRHLHGERDCADEAL